MIRLLMADCVLPGRRPGADPCPGRSFFAASCSPDDVLRPRPVRAVRSPSGPNDLAPALAGTPSGAGRALGRPGPPARAAARTGTLRVRWRGRDQRVENRGAGNPAVDGRVHGGISWGTVNGRPRQPDGPCSVKAETARLVRRRTGISAVGCVRVLERTADGVCAHRGHAEEQTGNPCGRPGGPIPRVPAA